MKHFQLNVPENFNFGYDVVDEWARIQPEKKAILWADDNGNEKSVTYGQFKDYSDKAASFLDAFPTHRLTSGSSGFIREKSIYLIFPTIPAIFPLL